MYDLLTLQLTPCPICHCVPMMDRTTVEARPRATPTVRLTMRCECRQVCAQVSWEVVYYTQLSLVELDKEVRRHMIFTWLKDQKHHAVTAITSTTWRAHD